MADEETTSETPAEETPPETPAPEEKPVETPAEETYSKKQVEEIIMTQRQNLDTFLKDPAKSKEFLEKEYGYKFAEEKAEEDDLTDPAVKELKVQIADLTKKLGETTQTATAAQQEALAGKFVKQWDAELASVKADIPELKSPKLYAMCRRDVMAAIEADPRYGEAGNIKKMAADWWKDREASHSEVAELRKTSPRGRPGGSVSTDKAPKDMTPEEAKEAILQTVLQANQ